MLAGCYSGAAGIIVLLIAKIYKKMYFRNLPFRVIVPVCYQMRLNVVFSGLSDNKKQSLATLLLQGIHHLSTLNGYTLHKLKN